MPSRRRRDGGGFTLFEVLAAVLVLGLFYTVLATKATQGVRAEGENRRRLEASLLADETLAQIETLIATGTPPPIESREEVFDPFTVAVEVSPLDLLPLLPTDLLPEDYEGDSLLALPNTGEDAFLRTVDVRVRWLEADEPREIRRTTYAYNETLVEGLLPSTSPVGGESVEGEPVDERIGGSDGSSPFLNEDGTPNLEKMREALMNTPRPQ